MNVYKLLISRHICKIALPVLKHFKPVWDHAQIQGRSQPHSPGWARVPLASFFPQILKNFSYFSSNVTYFLPHFGPPGGRLAHPGSPTREGPGYATAQITGNAVDTCVACCSETFAILKHVFDWHCVPFWNNMPLWNMLQIGTVQILSYIEGR